MIHNRKIFLEDRAEIEIKPDTFFVFRDLAQDRNPSKVECEAVEKRYHVFNSKELGTGTFAIVKLAIDKETGERLACKMVAITKVRLATPGGNVASAQAIQQEISILKQITHPNIVQIKDVIQSPTTVYIFLTRVMGGELFDYINNNGGIPEHEAKFIFYQVLRAVRYLHRRNITHRDLKLENLLLESAVPFSRIMLTDFGLAKMPASTLERMQTKCGTVVYLAPEIIDSPPGTGYSKSVDCWSLGVLLYTILSGQMPFGNVDNPSVVSKAIKSTTFSMEGQWGTRDPTPEARDLVLKLLNVNAKERLTVEGALLHPWIAKQKETLDKLYVKMLRKSHLPAPSFQSEPIKADALKAK
ncbi:Checkpoint kinase 2 [Rhizophlyctis rosea]|uniref:Checkpoint kinase 2 n=1 Tax=Rhizophlyctis rosea TaxID=64517 RepID=A0AAD5S9W5_9FUNG|nr:Checkpoint kinase 2 [Rhizophlyctis rosea]